MSALMSLMYVYDELTASPAIPPHADMGEISLLLSFLTAARHESFRFAHACTGDRPSRVVSYGYRR